MRTAGALSALIAVAGVTTAWGCGAFGAASGGDAMPDAGTPADSASDAPPDTSTVADADPPGDGAPSGACPTNVPCASGKCTVGKCEPSLFVSVQTVRGDFGTGGDPGFRADEICAAEGRLLHPLTTFFAWLGGVTSPLQRGLRLAQRPYWTPGTSGGVRIAETELALRSLPLLAPIARRDGSAAIAPPWTNVTVGETVLTGATESCASWVDGSVGGLGALGDPASKLGGFWAAHPLIGGGYAVGGCDVLRPIYCVEDVLP